MSRYEERRSALRQLVKGFGRGGIARVSREAGVDQSYLSRLLYDTGKAGSKNMGEDLVEKMTAAFPNWLSALDKNKDPKKSYDEGYTVLEAFFDTGSEVGNSSFDTVRKPEVLQRVKVLSSWAQHELGGDLSRIKLITASGTSMQGTIENGDILFVDATVCAYDGDGIYVISQGGDVQVKRLQKLHGHGLAIISDNRAYESERIFGNDVDSLIICGRVLAAWTLKKFW